MATIADLEKMKWYDVDTGIVGRRTTTHCLRLADGSYGPFPWRFEDGTWAFNTRGYSAYDRMDVFTFSCHIATMRVPDDAGR